MLDQSCRDPELLTWLKEMGKLLNLFFTALILVGSVLSLIIETTVLVVSKLRHNMQWSCIA